jgi:hypothetical protein
MARCTGSPTGPTRRSPNGRIGVYTVWGGDELIYVGPTSKCPAVSLVRDEEARARRVPDGAVAREARRPLGDDTAGTVACLTYVS